MGIPVLITTVIVTLISYLCTLWLYNVFFHPLARIPGPLLWRSSRLPFVRYVLAGTLVHKVEKLHLQYGPIVRIAPDEVTFAHPDSWDDVLTARPGQALFPKNPIWWTRPGPDSIISTMDHAKHARMRKALAPGFTSTALLTQEPTLYTYVELLIQRLREHASTTTAKPVDMVPWFNFTTFDIFGDLGFAESFDCLQKSQYHPWVELLFNSIKMATFMTSTRFYPLFSALLRRLIPRSLKEQRDRHFAQIVDKVDRRLNWETDRLDLMHYIAKENERATVMTLEEMHATFQFLVIASSETTATTLCGITTYMMLNPDKLEMLVNEIRTTFKHERDISLDSLRDLPYLNAVINEGLRLSSPVPYMMPRLVPPGGATVCGTFLPAGTSVSIQAYSIHRSPSLFHDASSFHPERWLSPPPKEFTSDRLDAAQPFGAGPYSCMGRHLAWAEMRLILARLLHAFDIAPAGEIIAWEKWRAFIILEKQPVRVILREKQKGNMGN